MGYGKRKLILKDMGNTNENKTSDDTPPDSKRNNQKTGGKIEKLKSIEIKTPPHVSDESKSKLKFITINL